MNSLGKAVSLYVVLDRLQMPHSEMRRLGCIRRTTLRLVLCSRLPEVRTSSMVVRHQVEAGKTGAGSPWQTSWVSSHSVYPMLQPLSPSLMLVGTSSAATTPTTRGPCLRTVRWRSPLVLSCHSYMGAAAEQRLSPKEAA